MARSALDVRLSPCRTTATPRLAALVLAIGLALATCSESDPVGPTAATCVEGTTQTCACSGGRRGVQTCTAEGRFGSCDCDRDRDVFDGADVGDEADTTSADTSLPDTTADSVVADTEVDDLSGADTASSDTTSEDGDVPDSVAGDTGGEPDVADSSDVGLDDSCVPAFSGGELVPEPLDAEEEWGDCFDGCAHDELFILNIPALEGDALRGLIDDRPHSYSEAGIAEGPDIDIIGLQLPARTMLEIIVEALGDAPRIQPVIWTHDSFQGLTFGYDTLGDGRTARTVLAAPYIGNLPFFVGIEHTSNYEVFGEFGAEYVGGTGYDYTVRFRTWPFEAEDLSTLGAERTSASAEGVELSCPGDIHYYRFEAPTDGEPTVAFSRTGSTDFVGVVVGLNATGGEQLVWKGIVTDFNDADPGNGHVQLPSSLIVPDSAGEFLFAVTDWNGRGQDDFTYNVTVTLGE